MSGIEQMEPFGGDPPLARARFSDGFWRLLDANYQPVAGIVASDLGSICVRRDKSGKVTERFVYYTDQTGTRLKTDLPFATSADVA